MQQFSFTVENLEFFLLIVARTSGFAFSSPIFRIGDVPNRLKAGFSVVFSILIFNIVPVTTLQYSGVVGFAVLAVKETLCGLILGYFTNIVMSIVGFAGRIIDMEIGLSMVTEFDPVTKVESSISGNIYTYFLSLMLLVMNFHYFLIRAFADTYKIIPVAGVNIHEDIYTLAGSFLIDFFLIAFRIVLPVYGTMLLINVVLGVMVKVAPQMNMFVIGMQIKIFAGLAVMVLIIGLLPGVTDFIVSEMKTFFEKAVVMMS
ncbi:MAG: flagellar biosynthetic protein FliR [Lachnospiraceae bacterium]|nr:flagellar biosynthetic protein FliR [Lachnospiraceae bacterium]